jgi:Sec-independent protein secretion pathway component TatC
MTSEFFWKNLRYAILAIAIVVAIVTPVNEKTVLILAASALLVIATVLVVMKPEENDMTTVVFGVSVLALCLLSILVVAFK